jgi:hypothetical protein
MLAGNLLLATIGNSILLIWAGNNESMLWTAGIVLGLGFSTMLAAFSVFMENNLIFTNALGSFMIVCGSVVAAIYPLIVGNGVETNPEVLSYVNFISIGACVVALIAGGWISRDRKVVGRS